MIINHCVIRYCFVFGRNILFLDRHFLPRREIEFSSKYITITMTMWDICIPIDPAKTNSSGVNTPFFKKKEDEARIMSILERHEHAAFFFLECQTSSKCQN
jgi:hypothetical protein